MQKLSFKAFTLVELIVVITILAILATIGYVSILGYGVTARDTTRLSDINNISKVLELYKVQEGVYPPVTNPVNVTFSGGTIWQQGSFGEDTRKIAKRISQVPIDPLTGNEYAYSRTTTTGEFQVGTIVEKASTLSSLPDILTQQTYAVENPLKAFATTLIKGNYNGKFIVHKEEDTIYILGVPSILSDEITDVTLQQIFTNNSFVYEGGPTPPATYSGSLLDNGTWTFTPTDTTGETYLIHTGSLSEMNTGTGKIDFIGNLKTYYTATDVASSDSYKELISINTTTNPNGAITLANTYIQSGIGGLSGEDILLTEIDNSSETTSLTIIPLSSGGDVSAVYNNYGGYYNAPVSPNTTAMAALREDGSIDVWGNASNGGSGAPSGTGFVAIYPNESAFAAIKSDGSIEAWGSASLGGTGAPSGTGYTSIYSNGRAFAAIRPDGSIDVWGDASRGGSGAPGGTGYTEIAGIRGDFAALHEDGSIVSWGIEGGAGVPVGTGFTSIYSTYWAFAALHEDGSIIAWGDGSYGGVNEPTGTGFTNIFSNEGAFAALHEDGSIDAWGEDGTFGQSGEPTGTGFTNIFSTNGAFTAIKSDGSLESWGDVGESAPSGTGFTKVYSTYGAFSAIAPDGSLKAWGGNSFGGDEGSPYFPSGTGFVDIYSNLQHFAAKKSDGTLYAWGQDSYVGGSISNGPPGGSFSKVYSIDDAFTGLMSDGIISSWGNIGGFFGTGDPTGTGFIMINGTDVD